MNTRKIVRNIRSSAVIKGKPKLPQPTDLDFGEIAINYAEGYETLSFKNNSNNIASLSVKTVDDVKVNGNSVVSNKTANITMKGNTTPVADTYSTTTFPSPFESKAEHISATDKVDAALKKVETNISKLVNEVVDNENVVSEAISKLANSAGTIDGSNNITYVKATNAHYINNASSVHDATVKLDTNVFTINSSVNTLGNEVITIKGDVTTIKGDINALKGRVNTIESNVTSIGGKVTYLETLTSDVSNLKTQVTNLKSFCDTNFHQAFGQIGDLQVQINSLRGIISSIPTMEFVDLGLPSGTLWAKCNIGAATETDYGDYFMWGSTTPDNNHTCNWANTPFNNGLSDYDSTHFDSVKNTLCPGDVLAKEFDAAYKATNGMGRMPTVADIQELLRNTEYEWFENYNSSGVKGRKFTSKINSNSIFIPASGWRIGSSFQSRGINCYFWSSTLMTSDPKYAWGIIFGSDADNITETFRNNGNVVRAVRKL